MTLKVMSYNIHKGFTMSQRFILDQIRDAMSETHADLVFLQEVLGEYQTHPKKDEKLPLESQFEFLADSVWEHFAYGKNAAYSSGHHGNAILSKRPIVQWENIDISTNRLEKRGILHAVIEMPTEMPTEMPSKMPKRPHLHVICIHLNLFQKSRIKQVDLLCQRIEAHVPRDAPLIIAGDFNDWKQVVSDTLDSRLGMKEVFLHKTGVHARSFPSWLPMLQLDRIYCRGFTIQKAKLLAGAPWNRLSDHLALYAELEI